MTKHVKEAIVGDDWDTRALGAEEEFAKEAPKELEAAIDAALELQLISIRMPKHVIDGFKYIASRNNIKYQTLMKQVLDRFVVSEMKQIAREMSATRKKIATTAEMAAGAPPSHPAPVRKRAA